MNKFFDLLTGGFFNYIGALIRLPFEKEPYNKLVEENISNTYGMLVTTVLLFAIFAFIKFT